MQDSTSARSCLFAELCWLGLLAWGVDAQLKGSSLLEKVKQCPNEGAPVCGANGTDLVLFPNDCIREETNNETYLGKPGFQRVALGFCLKHCNLICSTGYEPICALDVMRMHKRTFINRCEMTRDACLTNIGWLHFEDGECASLRVENLVPESPQSEIEKRNNTVPCSSVFNPVCAILSGVKSTFDNECQVKAENAKTGTNWKIFSHGVCAEDYASRYSNSIKNKNVTTRSNSPLNADDSNANLEKEFGPDVTYIYTPPVFQTQFIRNNPTYEQPMPKPIKVVPRVHSKSSPNEGFYRAMNMPPMGQFGHFNPFMSPGLPLNYPANNFKAMPPYLPAGAKVPQLAMTPPKRVNIPRTASTKPNPMLSSAFIPNQGHFNLPVSNALPVFKQDSLRMMPKQSLTAKTKPIASMPVKQTILSPIASTSTNTNTNTNMPSMNHINHKLAPIPLAAVHSATTTTTTTTTAKPQTVNATSSKIMTPFTMLEPYLRHGYHHQQQFPPRIPDVQEFDGKLKECKYGPLPVCGTLDGKMRTFNNFCELLLRSALLKQAWTILHDGKCYSCTNLDECTHEYRPICVSRNGINYTMSNECLLSAGMCQDQRSSWKILSRGECVSPYKDSVVDKYESSTPGYRYTSLYRDYTTHNTNARSQAELLKSPQSNTNNNNSSGTSVNNAAPIQKIKAKTNKTTVSSTTTAPMYKSIRKPYFVDRPILASIPKDAAVPTVTSSSPISTSTTATRTASISTTTMPTTTSTTTTTTTPKPTTTTTTTTPKPTTTTTTTTTTPKPTTATTTPKPTTTTTTTTTLKPTTERVSVYGYGKNSYIMRLVRKKGLKLKL